MLEQGPEIYLWIKHCTTSGVYLSSIYMYVHFCCGLCDKLFQLIFSFSFFRKKTPISNTYSGYSSKMKSFFVDMCHPLNVNITFFVNLFFFFFFIKHCFMILVVIMSYMNSKIPCFLYNENRPS